MAVIYLFVPPQQAKRRQSAVCWSRSQGVLQQVQVLHNPVIGVARLDNFIPVPNKGKWRSKPSLTYPQTDIFILFSFSYFHLNLYLASCLNRTFNLVKSLRPELLSSNAQRNIVLLVYCMEFITKYQIKHQAINYIFILF